jgi:hypothetical protein
MNLYEKDYNRLYHLQDKFFSWWSKFDYPFYLTGGTALGRFYLNHRFSDDLDFFITEKSDYNRYISEISKILTSNFDINIQQTLVTDDFSRFFLTEGDIFLKVEFVNDPVFYAGELQTIDWGIIDNPLNILSNKLTALIGRDEPKDIFDVIYISLNFSFNWMNVFSYAKQKAVINELDVEQRLNSFPLGWLENVNWLVSSVDLDFYSRCLKQIADDFLLGKANSLGAKNLSIEKAKPVMRID